MDDQTKILNSRRELKHNSLRYNQPLPKPGIARRVAKLTNAKFKEDKTIDMMN